MGRKPSRWANLPKGMRARPRYNKIFYYLDTGEKPRKEIPLGSDYHAAVAEWAKLTSKQVPKAAEKTLAASIEGYIRDVLPTKAPRTRADNEKEIAWLLKFFNDPPAPLEDIEPTMVKQYMRWRCSEARRIAEEKNAERVKADRAPQPIPDNIGHVRANRDKALLSHIWNYAREEGHTAKSNPCAGIHSFHEEGRDSAPDAELFQRVYDAGDVPVQFALRLANITGQRPADVVGMSEANISDGMLTVRQGKTGMKLRIIVEGDLAVLIDDIKAYKKTLRVYNLALLVNEKGQALTMHALRNRFDDARARAGCEKDLFQFRDLRAKAATETDEANGVKAAQALLGHTTEGMTAEYIRRKVGKKVSPIR